MWITEMEIHDPEIGLGIWSLCCDKLPSALTARRTEIQGHFSQQILHFLMAVWPELDPDHGGRKGRIRHSPMSARAMDPVLLTVKNLFCLVAIIRR